MPDPSLLLGAAVVKAALKVWLKEHSFASDTAVSLADIVQAKVTDSRARRRATRLFEDLEETVADQVLDTLRHEFSNLVENEKAAALLAVGETFSSCSLDEEDLFESDLDPLYLEKHVRRARPNATDDLSESATALYNRILRESCAYIVEISGRLPRFEVGAFAAILRRQSEVLEQLKELISRVPRQDLETVGGTFESAYLQIVAQQMDTLELFGVSLAGIQSSYPLSTAYISLNIESEALAQRVVAQRPGSSEAGAEVSERSPVVLLEDALSLASRLFIRGEAGSGKTTLLQWLAVRSARRDFPTELASWNDTVPFVIKLRSYSGRDLPRPEHFLFGVGRHISDEMPAGWVHAQLRSGRALVLIDGVDELPEMERNGARQWLRELVASHPSARYVITSRPAAASDSWLAQEDFDLARIQPMSRPDIESFVSHWHEAFKSSCTDQEQCDRIDRARAELLDAVASRRHLRQLATSPLMAALLCALNLDRRMQLPHDRMELYAIALEMLLDRRDREREVPEGDPVLLKTDKILILKDLAYWLIRNGWSDAPADRVKEFIQQRTLSMTRVSAEPERVLKALLDRSGLIREPAVSRIDFIHRTFQEYLAAKAIIDSDDVGVLIEHARNDQWYEVFVMAVGHASLPQRNEILRRLLGDAKDSRYRHRLHVLAVACLETSSELDPAIHKELEQVAARLIPPKTIKMAEAIVGAGEVVLDLLGSPRLKSPAQAVATIRAASLIGGDDALRLIQGIVDSLANNGLVITEATRAWSFFDAEKYAQEILAQVGHLPHLGLSDPTRLPGLRYLALQSLLCRFSNGHGDLSFAQEIETLTNLTVDIDPALTDINGIAQHPRLEGLELHRTGVTDLSPIARIPRLSDLDFRFSPKVDISVLQSLENIKHLQISGLKQLNVARALSPRARLRRFGLWQAEAVQELGPLAEAPQLSSLDFLLIGGGFKLSSIEGIEQWSDTLTGLFLAAPTLRDPTRIGTLSSLEFLNMAATPAVNLDFITNCPKIRILHVLVLNGKPNLAPLRELTKLTDLYIWGEGLIDLRPLVGTRRLKIHIRDRNTARREVIGSELLGSGSRVSHVG